MMLVYKLPWVITTLLIAFALFKYVKRYSIVILGLIALLIHFSLAYLRLYPYSARTLLYIFPLLITLISAGTWTVISYLINKTNLRVWGYVLIIPILLSLYSFSKKIPFEKVEMRQALNSLDSRIKKTDKLYIFSASKPTFDFYQNWFDNLESYEIIDESIIEDCNSFKGMNKNHSIWVLFSLNFPHKLLPENIVDNFIKSIEKCSFKEITRHYYKDVIIYEFKKNSEFIY